MWQYIVIGVLLAIVAILCMGVARIGKRCDEQDEFLRFTQEKLSILVMNMRDTWDHLPSSLPISEDMRGLAWIIGVSLPRLYGDYRDGRDRYRAGLLKFDPRASFHDITPDDMHGLHSFVPDGEIDRLVKWIDHPEITRLWKLGTLESITDILRVILFMPIVPNFTVNCCMMPNGPHTYGLVPRAPRVHPGVD